MIADGVGGIGMLNAFPPGVGFVVPRDERTEREIVKCITAICAMPESDVKKEILRQMIPVLERLNHPMMSLNP